MSDEKIVNVLHYRQLTVWQKAVDLADQIFETCATFPKQELYGLSSQIKRSVVSIPSNIAEGAARQGTGEFLHFISIAKGSLAELETQLIIANRRQFVDSEQLNVFLSLTDEISRMLSGLSRSLKQRRAA